MSRPAKVTSADSKRLQKQELNRTAPLRDLFPELSELRVELEFEDGTSRPPSLQTYSYFPAARTQFRYACPCRGCNGEFGLHDYIAEVATEGAPQTSHRQMTVVCPGQRLQSSQERTPCPIRVSINISATLRAPEPR